jgi:hypothetical protein
MLALLPRPLPLSHGNIPEKGNIVMNFFQNQLNMLKETTTLRQRIILTSIGACYIATALLALKIFLT